LAAQGRLGTRITTGTLRNCAVFTAPVRDAAGVFVATHAVASALADCSDASLSGVTTTTSSSTSTSSTTTTTTFPCGGEGAPCDNGVGCCDGFTCLTNGGPNEFGTCTAAACTTSGVCRSQGACCALPCCTGAICIVSAPYPYDFCRPLGPPRCVQSTSACIDLPEIVALGYFPNDTAAPGLVCDAATPSCSATSSGTPDCCELGSSPNSSCYQGVIDPAFCALFPNGTVRTASQCGADGHCAP